MSLEKLTNCPLCGGDQFTEYLTCIDFTVSKEKFKIDRCQSCQFLFTNPRPFVDDLGRYYQSEEYISHSNKSNSLINSLYKVARFFTLGRKLHLIDRFKSSGDLLDVGCGTGHFLKYAESNGWNVTGIEPDKEARTMARAGLKGNVYERLESLGSSNFDVITLWHVLEHIPDLNERVQSLASLLNENGTLLLAVPNHRAPDAGFYKAHWAAYDVPRHLYHFDPITMKMLLDKHHLTIREIIPMKLDAFYVSLLSEKIKKSGIIGYIRAFFIGIWSNYLASRKEKNYSSLIYVVRR